MRRSFLARCWKLVKIKRLVFIFPKNMRGGLNLPPSSARVKLFSYKCVRGDPRPSFVDCLDIESEDGNSVKTRVTYFETSQVRPIMSSSLAISANFFSAHFLRTKGACVLYVYLGERSVEMCPSSARRSIGGVRRRWGPWLMRRSSRFSAVRACSREQ